MPIIFYFSCQTGCKAGKKILRTGTSGFPLQSITRNHRRDLLSLHPLTWKICGGAPKPRRAAPLLGPANSRNIEPITRWLSAGSGRGGSTPRVWVYLCLPGSGSRGKWIKRARSVKEEALVPPYRHSSIDKTLAAVQSFSFPGRTTPGGGCRIVRKTRRGMEALILRLSYDRQTWVTFTSEGKRAMHPTFLIRQRKALSDALHTSARVGFGPWKSEGMLSNQQVLASRLFFSTCDVKVPTGSDTSIQIPPKVVLFSLFVLLASQREPEPARCKFDLKRLDEDVKVKRGGAVKHFFYVADITVKIWGQEASAVVALACTWIGQICRRKGSPGAEKYSWNKLHER